MFVSTFIQVVVIFAAVTSAHSFIDFKNDSPTRFDGVYSWEQSQNANLTVIRIGGIIGSDLENVYVARATHLDGLIPGYWIPDRDYMYMPFNTTEYDKREFEVLHTVNEALSWMSGSKGNYPKDPVVAGHYPSTNETLYVCRAVHGSNVLSGSLRMSTDNCTVPWKDGAHEHTEFEILALNDYGRFLINHSYK